MLVLTRKVDEAVIVGEDNSPHRVLKVTVLAVRGNQVKLGLEVDADVPIRRSEVWKPLGGDGIANRSTRGFDAIPNGILGRRTEDLGGES